MSEIVDDTFLTKQQLCTRWHIGERALEKRVANGKSPQPFKSGKNALFSLAAVIDHEIKNTKPPVVIKKKKPRPV